MTERIDLPPYPRGWFAVASSDELAPGDVRAVRYFGQELVLFRSQQGPARVFDAYCPHLGAHLGHGGTVRGDELVCPFHGWRFASDGVCSAMPYGKRIPPSARTRSLPVREQNGVVLVWHSPTGDAPDWEMPVFDDSNWTPCISRTWLIRGHTQEVCENTADLGHFRFIHQTHLMRALSEPKIDGPFFTIPMESDPEALVPELRLDQPRTSGSGFCFGPGLTAADLTATGSELEAMQRLYVTPVDEEHIELRGVVTVGRLEDPEATEAYAAGLAHAVFEQWEADVPIWEHKVYRKAPALNETESAIAVFRRWYEQFYSDDPESGMSDATRGLEVDPVQRWLAANVEGAKGPLRFELVAAGGSNLTYRVESTDGARWALRRPPERARIATAHDVAREWKILSALHAHPESGVPVPAAVAYCDDAEVTGAEFYVMGFADGLILRGPDEAAGMTAEDCRVASESLIDVQIAMHTLDAEAVGLGDLGRKDAYVERQLKRWLRQFEASQSGGSSEAEGSSNAARIYALHEQLLAGIPEQQGVGLVHGDYRFDNTVLAADHRIIAVLDWELCTLGDPVADFCWSVLYWSDPDDAFDFGSPSPTRHPAFPRRAEAIQMYAERSGFDLSGLDYYRAFSWWKMACLLEGVAARLRAGAAGGAGGGSGDEEVGRRIDWMISRATEAATRL